MGKEVDFAFLHGGGQGSWVWRETIDAMSCQNGEQAFRTLALDIPGCGEKRGRDTAKLTIDDIVAELLADIDKAGMKDVVLIGHSQAGNVLPRLVEAKPAVFRRLVYVTCSCPPPGQTVIQLMGPGQHGANPNEVGWPFDPKVVTDMRARYRIMFCNDMGEAEASAFLDKLGPDMWPAASYSVTDWRFDHLGRVPATFVVCLKDNILPLPWQEKFAEWYKCDRLVRIDAGHQVMNTRPNTLAEVLWHEV